MYWASFLLPGSEDGNKWAVPAKEFSILILRHAPQHHTEELENIESHHLIGGTWTFVWLWQSFDSEDTIQKNHKI